MDTILYHFNSAYHTLMCVCHRLNHRKKYFAVAVIEERTTAFVSTTYLEKVFDSVYICPTRAVLTFNPFEKVFQNGEDFFKIICGRYIEEYDEIITIGPGGSFSMYLAMRKIHFSAMEDSMGHMLSGGYFGAINLNRGSAWWKILDRLGFVDLTNPCVDKIYAWVPDGTTYSDSRIIPFNIKDELHKLNEEQLKFLCKGFNVEFKRFNKKTAVLASGNFCRTVCLSEKENIYIHTILVDYFVPENWEVCIKPHPGDVYLDDYKTVFPDSIILPHGFPSELITTMNNEDDILYITPSSYSYNFFKNSHLLGIYTSLGKYRKWLYTIHRQWAIKKIYDTLCTYQEQFLYKKFVDESFVYTWSIKNIYDSFEKDVHNMSIVVPVDSNEMDISLVKKFFERNTCVLVFYDIHEKMFEYLDLCPLPLLSKKICINKVGTDIFRNEYLYILTNNQKYWDSIRNLHCEKHLKYSKEDVVMDIMTDEELEIAILQGKLEATEKRLKQVLEENDELRAQIESRSA